MIAEPVALTIYAAQSTLYCSKRGKDVEDNEWCVSWKPKSNGHPSAPLVCKFCGHSHGCET